ncbi:MAG: hypothetical protein MUC62_04025 [Candidatus Thermoplasmatota archaeon]|jgi:glutaredoxin|nr:hypothetical protein [Candidatus Thermoplasmatota archaeon]
MEFVLYSLENCPFCKHFRRIFLRSVPDGKIVMLDGHSDSIWIEKDLHYVPTVIALEKGKEVDRLEAVKLVGIRYPVWLDWFAKYSRPDKNAQ